MADKDRFDEYLDMLRGKDQKVTSLVYRLLDQRAAIKDKEINSRLLQELIQKYAESENKLKFLNQELVRKQKHIDADLAAAAEIQKSLLPKDTRQAQKVMDISWRFRPCDKIGGDIFNIVPLDDDNWAFYMIDVAGHGIQAAMIAVTVFQYLQPHSGTLMSLAMGHPPIREIRRPAKVLEFLDREYPFERFNSFFTLNYAILNVRTGRLTASNAGHPPPVILRQDGELLPLEKAGRSIGTLDFMPNADEAGGFPEEHRQIQPGDKLLFYTDGLIEYENDAGELYGKQRFYQKISELNDRPVSELIDMSFRSLMEFGNNTEPKDDISLLGLELLKVKAPD